MLGAFYFSSQTENVTNLPTIDIFVVVIPFLVSLFHTILGMLFVPKIVYSLGYKNWLLTFDRDWRPEKIKWWWRPMKTRKWMKRFIGQHSV